MGGNSMSKYDILKLDNQLCFALYACTREITKMYQPYLDKLGLTYTQYITMLVLWENPKISFKDLSSKLFLDSGTLTPLLKKLENMGLLDRKRDPSDERSVIISLTTKGEEMKKAALHIPENILCSTGLSAEEAIALREQIKGILNQF